MIPLETESRKTPPVTGSGKTASTRCRLPPPATPTDSPSPRPRRIWFPDSALYWKTNPSPRTSTASRASSGRSTPLQPGAPGSAAFPLRRSQLNHWSWTVLRPARPITLESVLHKPVPTPPRAWFSSTRTPEAMSPPRKPTLRDVLSKSPILQAT